MSNSLAHSYNRPSLTVLDNDHTRSGAMLHGRSVVSPELEPVIRVIRSPSLEDRAAIKVLTSKMVTCGYPVTEDRSDRD
jgi:hypothetical protein